MATTDRRVREAFIELTDTLVRDFDIIDFLERLATRCTELLDVTACGVLLADHHGALTLVAASTEAARRLELAQVQNAEGPCMDAFHSGIPVQSGNLEQAGPRWPAFTAAARAAGFTAVQALPMRLREERLGALNLLNAAPGPLDSDTVALGQALADAATIGIVHQRTVARQEMISEQMQAALTSRIVIEQAKGFLAERLGLGVDDAFTALRQYARDHNRRLTEVAAEVVAGGLNIGPIGDAGPGPARRGEPW
jgi:transcriptional regulator with GAF, ATPase, and Fis domain